MFIKQQNCIDYLKIISRVHSNDYVGALVIRDLNALGIDPSHTFPPEIRSIHMQVGLIIKQRVERVLDSQFIYVDVVWS